MNLGKSFLDELTDGVAILDTEKRFLLCNTSFKNIFQISAETKIKKKPAAELIRHPGFLDIFERIVKTGKAANGEIEIGGGMEVRHMSVTATITSLNETGRDEKYLIIIHDISMQKKIERMRVDFVANVSHELKTPLTAINGFVETLIDGAINEPKVAEKFLKTIHKHSGRLNRLIEDLLALSNIELGDEKLKITEIDPQELMKSVVETFSHSAKVKGVTLSAKVEANTIILKGDRDRLTQVMVNLVDNSIKHTPQGKSVEILYRPLELSLENIDNSDYKPLSNKPLLPEDAREGTVFAEFVVQDTGEGIPEKSVPRLMERFYRVDRARSRELGGTGLGLSIVKHIVMAHNGSINIKSKLGKGTAISFIIPI